ncbi:MAG: putative signal transduction histidine kinase, partial [Chitinophagaceae bacterium]|nr:putative signal transduction histidine kinase [Chitinophagaceae bacterium]
KIIFTYYVCYYAIDKIVNKKRWPPLAILEILLVLLLCIIIDRIITNELIVPVAYHYTLAPAPIFEPRRVMIVILFAVFASGLMIAIRSVSNQLDAKEREKYLIKEKLEAELKFLRNQINPHFLLNTLYNIYALARKGSEETAEVVMRLSELLQFMLYESAGNLIPLHDEIKVLEDYLELEMIRYNNRLSVSFNKEVDSAPYQITPLLLLPYLENAFKHGVSETRFESFINLDIKVKDGLLNLEIENTHDPSPMGGEKKTIGLSNARRQLELTYRDHKLEINDDGSIFRLNLFINLKSYAEI